MIESRVSRRGFLAGIGALVASVIPLRLRGADATTAGSYCLASHEWEMLALINSYRAANGLGKLSMSATLAAAAEHHSVDMARNNVFSHTLSNGTSWSANIRNHGYSYNTYIAENIAAGNSTASATFTQWRNSAGHRANMLNRNYTAIGIGRSYVRSARYGYYWTTTFGGRADGGPC